MIAVKLTRHAQVDRMERLVECITHLGVNEIVYERVDTYKPTVKMAITDTGIILIRAVCDDSVITGYMATVKQAVALFQGRMPDALFRRVVNNNKKYSFLQNIQEGSYIK